MVSITCTSKIFVLSRPNISGHRNDRKLWFFYLTDLGQKYSAELKTCKHFQPCFAQLGLNLPLKNIQLLQQKKPKKILSNIPKTLAQSGTIIILYYSFAYAVIYLSHVHHFQTN
jgi:hypothetical protein